MLMSRKVAVGEEVWRFSSTDALEIRLSDNDFKLETGVTGIRIRTTASSDEKSPAANFVCLSCLPCRCRQEQPQSKASKRCCVALEARNGT